MIVLIFHWYQFLSRTELLLMIELSAGRFDLEVFVSCVRVHVIDVLVMYRRLLYEFRLSFGFIPFHIRCV